MAGVGIDIQDVGKKFATTIRKSMRYGMQDIACDLLGLSTRSSELRQGEFWGVGEVSVRLRPGDALGIVGPNGSGKSTLMKMINGIIIPDRGRINVRGRVGALIEVGAGFHPLLTGRENIFINGAILGMSHREIRKKFDSIVDFAEIGDFLDMPVKHYSSGMYVRLGFAVAAHCEPDILLVDEVLAVGDVRFRQKCFRFIEESILRQGVILCLVSHSIFSVARLCSRAILLEKGRVSYDGEASAVVPEYYRAMNASAGGNVHADSTGVVRHGAGEVRVADVEMRDEDGHVVDQIPAGAPVEFRFHLNALHDLPSRPAVFLYLLDEAGTVVAQSRWLVSATENIPIPQGMTMLQIRFESFNLVPGNYLLEIKLGGGDDLLQDFYRDAKRFSVSGSNEVYAATGGFGLVYLPSQWNLKPAAQEEVVPVDQAGGSEAAGF